MKEETSFTILLKAISKSGAPETLKALTKTEDFNEIIKTTKLDRGTVYKVLQQLENVGLVDDNYDFSIKRHRYHITPIGQKILSKLEELEQIWEEYQKEGLPREREKFLKKEEG